MSDQDVRDQVRNKGEQLNGCALTLFKDKDSIIDLNEMWVTHLSTLNNEFTDTTHEHVFSLAVFLVAAERNTR